MSKRQRIKFFAEMDRKRESKIDSIVKGVTDEHTENLDESFKNISMAQISRLTEPDEIYAAVKLAKDPETTQSELSKSQLQKYQKYSEKQTYKLNDTIRSKISESSRKAKKYASFRVCCGKKGNEETAVFQVEQEALADTLQQGATVEIINAKI